MSYIRPSDPKHETSHVPSVESIRRGVLETALRICAGQGGIAWLLSGYLAVRLEHPGIAVVATLLYAWVLGVLVARNLPVAIRAAAVIVASFGLSAFLVWHVGLLGLGPVWWVLGGNLVLAAIVVVPAIARLFRSMEDMVAHGRVMAAELDRERARLVETNDDLRSVSAELRRAEAERRRLAAAIEKAGTLIAILDADWRVEYVNPAFEHTTGFSRVEATGMPIDVVGGLGDDASVRQDIAVTVRERRTWSGRLRNRRRDGSGYDAEATISRIDGDGATSYVAVLRDISREITLEAQLRQSQKLEAMGTLAGGIAHDFNNLLVPIIGCTDAVRERLAADPETCEMLGDVKAAAERARDLVAQILTFSRKAETRREARAVAPIVREAARLLRAMLPAGIRIEERIDDTAGAVRADATELHQVIMNLATNAYHAMRRSGGILTLSVEALQADDMAAGSPARKAGCVRITVGDTGVGMDEATLQRVFDPFFTTKAAGEGTGLGLAMVHGTISALGGTIDVKSWPGAGTVIRIDLPASTESSSAPSAPTQPTAVQQYTGLHVLLVDDETAVRRVAHRMLERSGFRVTDVASGDEALARFRAHPDAFDAILTDFNMPGMTGIELACEMQGLRAGVPVVLASGYVDADALEAAHNCGVRRIVHKPFSPSEIASAVAAAVVPSKVA